MRYTLICANILIIVLVSFTTIRGLIKINDRSYFDALPVRKSSAQTGKQETKGVKHQSVALIADSFIRYFNALLGLWAGVKFTFNYLIGYGVSLIISLVLTIIVGLGGYQLLDDLDIESYSLGVFHIFISVFLALLSFRLSCITKSGFESNENESEVHEDQQNQCEIV